jgi:carboxypeptidase C (cathepsin A)
MSGQPNTTRRRLLGGFSVAALAALPDLPALGAPAEHLNGAVVTQHTVGALAYTATYTVYPLRDDAGAVQATIAATSYVVDALASPTRPVLFLYNGGPGSSSSMLQFGGLGPRRLAGPESALKMIDNEQHLLAEADLVFIDPVGTGFNQIPAGGNGKPYWTADGDAQATLTAVRGWLAEHRRASSPVYLCGESYGGFRTAMMCKFVDDLPLAGLILVSPLLDLSGHFNSPGNDQPYIINLPSMAVAAWFHGRTARGGRTAAQVFESARRYAQGEYAAALQLGRRLPPADAQRIATSLSALIGMPVQGIVDAKLRIDGETYMNTLLQDPALRIGSLDTRVVGSAKRPRTPAQPTTDPSFPSYGLGGAIGDYFRNELKVPVSRPFVTLTLDVNRAWDYRPSQGAGFYIDGTTEVAAAMEKHAAMRLLITGGYFDMSIPYLGSIYSVDHAGFDPARVSMAAMESGHSPYDDEATLHVFAEHLSTFLRGKA